MGDEFLPLMQAAAYLGVSRMKLSRMVSAGELAFVTSPLDKRVKLFRREDLDRLRLAPRPARQLAEPETAKLEA
jgi:excisionase family DNA binding protein